MGTRQGASCLQSCACIAQGTADDTEKEATLLHPSRDPLILLRAYPKPHTTSDSSREFHFRRGLCKTSHISTNEFFLIFFIHVDYRYFPSLRNSVAEPHLSDTFLLLSSLWTASYSFPWAITEKEWSPPPAAHPRHSVPLHSHYKQPNPISFPRKLLGKCAVIKVTHLNLQKHPVSVDSLRL